MGVLARVEKLRREAEEAEARPAKKRKVALPAPVTAPTSKLPENERQARAIRCADAHPGTPPRADVRFSRARVTRQPGRARLSRLPLTCRKKLRQIEAVERQQASGTALSPEQLAKVARKASAPRVPQQDIVLRHRAQHAAIAHTRACTRTHAHAREPGLNLWCAYSSARGRPRQSPSLRLGPLRVQASLQSELAALE